MKKIAALMTALVITLITSGNVLADTVYPDWQCRICNTVINTRYCEICDTRYPWDKMRFDPKCTSVSLKPVAGGGVLRMAFYGPDSNAYASAGAYKPEKATQATALFAENDYILVRMKYGERNRCVYFHKRTLRYDRLDQAGFGACRVRTLSEICPRLGPGYEYDEMINKDYVAHDGRRENAKVIIPKGVEIKVLFETDGWLHFECMASIGLIRAWVPISDVEDPSMDQETDEEKKDENDDAVEQAETLDVFVNATAAEVEAVRESVRTLDTVMIDKINFPDEVFRKIIRNYDLDSDGALIEDEILRIDSLELNNRGIRSLKGIEYFINLRELECDENELVSLDLSRNIKLEILHCDQNRLTTLDFSHNPKLRILWCVANQLTNLNVTQNAELVQIICSSNEELNELDLSGNLSLCDLFCAGNGMVSLDVSKNKMLESLVCSGNNLTSLDLSGNENLRGLWCFYNDLIHLNLEHNPLMEEIICYGNNLITLDVSKCPKLNKLVITRKPGRDPEHDSYGWWADDQENPGYLTECVLIDDNVKITTSEGVF